MIARVLLPLLLIFSAVQPVPASAGQLLYSTEGNRLRRYDVDTIGQVPFREDILVERGSLAPDRGHDINGMICPLPDGSGRFIAGEDTRQIHPPPGWGLFSADGALIGKLAATYYPTQGEPFGCAFDPSGRLFVSEVGEPGFGTPNGQLIVFFPPFDVFPGPPGAYPDTDATSTRFCKLATDIGTASAVLVDEQGRVYVSSSSGFQVIRFSPPFPTGPDAAGGCGLSDALGSPLATQVQRETFLEADFANGILTFSGLARALNGNLYVASVATGRIGEYTPDGAFVRLVVQPPEASFPFSTGSPQGIAVGDDGTLYYADLDLVGNPPADLGPGPNGKVRRVRFDAQGNPLPPEIVKQGLAFPDGVTLFPGDLEPPPQTEWRTFAGSYQRRFFNSGETTLTAANVAGLDVRWRFPTGAIITASPSVASVVVPGEGRQQIVYFQSWDGNVYAVRLADGSELWRRAVETHPGASYPGAASVDVSNIGGEERVLVASGEILYALDARTGAELWRFTAGTGCRDASGQPPGLCAFDGERNEIESSVVVADGKVFFGLDTNDVATGKGGVFAVSAADGRLTWFFDLESGETCRPLATDAIRRYDGYHSAAQLGLPGDFFATRPGCGADRTPTGCGNVWSSPAYDPGRGLLYFTSSNCDTDSDPATGEPPPPMPSYDEAVFALKLDGTPVWRWRPREVDNDDLAFGAAPNLFTIEAGGATRDVLGVGNKDGTYTVLDRDGVNEVTGVRWDDSGAAAALPYWSRNVVPGGSIGGIPQTAAVDEAARRVLFSTAPGDEFDDLFTPQTPTLHALALDTGAVDWDSSTATLFQPEYASYGPTSAIPGVVFFGTVPTTFLRVHDSANGTELTTLQTSPIYFGGVASGAVVVDGTVLVGGGIGSRGPGGQGDTASRVPFDLVALCVPGTTGCAACNDGRDDDGDGATDYPADPGCASTADLSEAADCDDGLDNDHDGRTDFPADAGCRNRLPRASESPACSNGRDDDADGKTDFPADPSCTAAWSESETAPPPAPSCGLLGAEAVAALAAVRALRGRRRPHRVRGAAAAACLVAVLVSRDAAAEPVPVAVSARMTVYLGDSAVYTGAPVSGSALLDADGGTLDLAAGLISARGLVIPVAAGAFGTVTRLTLDASNAAGRFSFGGGASGACPGPLNGAGACVQGGGFGGLMALSGALRVSPLGTTIPLGVVGAGGVAGSQVVLQGAPWTARTAAVTTTGTARAWYTRMGQESGAPGPTLVLVTPIHVSSSLTSERLPFFLELTLAVPEPGTALLLAAGVGGIALLRRRRARRDRRNRT